MFHKQTIPPMTPLQEGQDDAQEATTQTQDNQNKDTNAMSFGQDNQSSDTQTSPFQTQNPIVGQNSAFSGVAQTTTRSDERRLIIGEGITMSGEIENCDQLIVEGTVEATLNGAKLLDIAENGVFYGSVDIEEAVIAGRFEGDLTVDGRVTITSTGKVRGSIIYRELVVDAGANIEGKIATFASASAQSDAAPATDFSKLKAASKKSEGKKTNAA